MKRERSILLIEDDEHLRERLNTAFLDRGYACRVARGVRDGREILEREEIDLVVTDLRLEDGSGLDLVKNLHLLRRDAKAVVLSGYGTISVAVEALKCGAVNFLTKPAHADKILEALGEPNPELVHESSRSLGGKSQEILPSLDQMEWEYLSRVLSECQGNISQAAQRLGLHRRTLQRKLAKKPSNLR